MYIGRLVIGIQAMRAAGLLCSCMLKDYINSLQRSYFVYLVCTALCRIQEIPILRRFSHLSRVPGLLTDYATRPAPLNRTCFASNH